MLSPVRYTQRKFRAGGTQGSVFSLVAATLGSGTIAFPYAVSANGLIFGPLLIILGALISYFSGMLIVAVAAKTKTDRYEDMARTLYNKRVEKVVSVLNIICLVGFGMSYIVFVKQTVPFIILKFVDKLPSWCDDTQYGQAFWAVLFSVLVVFPLSIPRSVNALRFSSLFGVLCSIYLCLAVMFSFFLDTKTVPHFEENWKKAKLFVFTFDGIVNSMPLIIFAYMYQVNIPSIYLELERRNYKTMSTVVYMGTFLAVVCYIMIGIFGYLTFDLQPASVLNAKNILLAPYKSNVAILVANFAVLFAVITAAPLVILPCKDSIEELKYKDGMNSRQNLIVTFLLVFISMLLALVIPGIGYAITLAGCTTNPIIGFFVPIFFYNKATPDEPLTSPKKILCIITFVIISVSSVLGFYNFIKSLIDFHKT